MKTHSTGIRSAIALCTVLLVTGTAFGQVPDASSPQPSAAQASKKKHLPEFRLSPGDVIEIKFFYNAELNDSIQIQPDGQLNLPLVGEVQLAGRTVPEATAQLEALYVPHLKTPEITIVVRVFASQKVYVGGEVVRPGVIVLAGEMHVFDAIMEAGGIKHTGKKSSVVLLRKGPDGARTMQVLRLLGDKGKPSEEANLLLRPFDVVLVPETKIARLDRWVDQHVRQVVPVAMTAGFTYLFNSQVVP